MKEGVPIKPKYRNDVNIDLIPRKDEFTKYQTGVNIKLFTNDVKVAIVTAPTALLLGALNQSEPISTGLYIISGCALAYAITNLYLHKKEKQKKFTIKWAFYYVKTFQKHSTAKVKIKKITIFV